MTKALASATYSITFDGGAKDDPKEHEWVNCTMTIDPGVQKKFKLWLLKPKAPEELTSRVNSKNVGPFLEAMVAGQEYAGIKSSEFMSPDPMKKVSWYYKAKNISVSSAYIKQCVRDMKTGHHEWVPVSEIAEITQAATDPAQADRAADFKEIIQFLLSSRSPTQQVVFKPDDWTVISAAAEKAAAGNGVIPIKAENLMSGHSGAIKFPGKKKGSSTKGQKAFHDELRAALATVIKGKGGAEALKAEIRQVVARCIWNGKLGGTAKTHAAEVSVDFLGRTMSLEKWGLLQEGAFDAIMDVLETVDESY